MTISVNVRVLPTGGGIVLDFAQGAGTSPLQGSVTITRSVVGSSNPPFTVWTGQGPDMYLFVDVNDGNPGPLLSNQSYTYTITDQTGSLTTDAVTPIGAITLIQHDDTALLARLLQLAVANVTLPPIVTERPVVTTAMPIAGQLALPLLVVNEDLLQQDDIPIGQQVEQLNPDLTVTIGGFAKYLWRVSILCKNAPSRDFWKSAVIAIFQSLCGSVFAPIGKNISHRYQAASFQVQSDQHQMVPGFYGADIMLELVGVLNTTIQTSYGLIEHIDFTATFPDGATQQADMPEHA